MFKTYVDFYFEPQMRQISEYHVLRIGEGFGEKSFGNPVVRPYHFLFLPYEGSGVLEYKGLVQKISKGDVMILPAETICYMTPDKDDPWSFYWIDFTGTRADQVMSQLVFASKETLVFHNVPLHEYLDVFRREIKMNSSKNSSYFMTISCLMELFALLARDFTSNEDKIRETPDAFMYKIRQFIDMNYYTTKSMQEIAREYNIHPNYMTRLFRQTFGITPKQYIQSLKLTKACEMLAETDLPISHVAVSMGYQDQLAFSKAFHKAYGVSPSQYRTEHRTTGPINA